MAIFLLTLPVASAQTRFATCSTAAARLWRAQRFSFKTRAVATPGGLSRISPDSSRPQRYRWVATMLREKSSLENQRISANKITKSMTGIVGNLVDVRVEGAKRYPQRFRFVPFVYQSVQEPCSVLAWRGYGFET
jgi:hypothetical protein